MTLQDSNPNLYEILEVSPSASAAEIRTAYLRIKAAFRKDSAALYSLISEDETDSILRSVESAYQVLSNPDKRREYDLKHPHTELTSEIDSKGMSHQTGAQVISIDRVPPMENSLSSEEILVAPSTDFMEPPAQGPWARTTSHSISRDQTKAPATAHLLSEIPNTKAPDRSETLREIDAWIKEETTWSGDFIRKVRESRGNTIEEIAEYSKISRTYIHAIEEEIYEKLPAPVYLRGFLAQIAKFLKLPADRMITGYLARYSQMRDARRA